MNEPLDAQQEDTLKELFNLSLGRAVTALSEMVGEEVLIGLPELQLIERERLAEVIAGHLATEVGMVGMPFRLLFADDGEVDGVALLLVPETSRQGLLETLMGQRLPAEAGPQMAQETMREVGDLMLYTCVSSLSRFLDSEIVGEAAETVACGEAALLALLPESNPGAGPLAELRVRFHLPDQREVKGALVFLLDLGALPRLREELNRVLGECAL